MTDKIKELLAEQDKRKTPPPTQKANETDAQYEARLEKVIASLDEDAAEETEKQRKANEGAAAKEADVPVYEAFHTSFQIAVMVPDSNKPGEFRVKPALQFRGVHRGFGVLRLDDATLHNSGLTLEQAVELIEGNGKDKKPLPEFARGLKDPGVEGGIWRQSARGKEINQDAMKMLRQAIDMYDLETLRAELKRMQLAIPQQGAGEPPAKYLARLRDLLYRHFAGDGPTKATAATEVSRGAGTR